MKSKLSPSVKNKLKNFGIKLVYLFGSTITGNSGINPDIDIAVLSSSSPDLQLYEKLYKLFTSFFLSEKKEIDIIFLNHAPLPLIFEVVSEGKLLFELTKGFSLEYKERITKLYIDFKFHLEQTDKVILDAFK